MHNFRELKIWVESIQLTTDVYKLTSKFPKSEQYNLISQINRSSVSIPSNIAEGSSRRTTKGFIQFLDIALGSTYELETQLIIAGKLDYIQSNNLSEILNKTIEIQKMINGFIRNLRNNATGINKLLVMTF
ncbi:MAG: four helix bundle protein [Bacteroidetes bacterium]|jgi:four helix bundle protein|nr:four helix bundle protein [Bacteroidota bacterium]MBT5527584.1 four helix bundle protein [Cytophagia bacterium]MBT3422584.1 four helix bundle protein [Bacteroidota bacterium]MBT3802682.1 four helix bundle protein [Bacteroidota bacterium]MBT3934339.1 four helix bundle protein [Bacteroidota bacterium]